MSVTGILLVIVLIIVIRAIYVGWTFRMGE